MSGHVKWSDIRAEYVARAGGEAAVEAGRRELLAEVHQAAEDRIQGGRVTEHAAARLDEQINAIRAEYAEEEAEAAEAEAAERTGRGGPAVINPDPAGIRPFPWQCPACGHRREDHHSPGANRSEAAWPVGNAVPAWATCGDCPSCTGPTQR